MTSHENESRHFMFHVILFCVFGFESKCLRRLTRIGHDTISEFFCRFEQPTFLQ